MGWFRKYAQRRASENSTRLGAFIVCIVIARYFTGDEIGQAKAIMDLVIAGAATTAMAIPDKKG